MWYIISQGTLREQIQPAEWVATVLLTDLHNFQSPIIDASLRTVRPKSCLRVDFTSSESAIHSMLLANRFTVRPHGVHLYKVFANPVAQGLI